MTLKLGLHGPEEQQQLPGAMHGVVALATGRAWKAFSLEPDPVLNYHFTTEVKGHDGKADSVPDVLK